MILFTYVVSMLLVGLVDLVEVGVVTLMSFVAISIALLVGGGD